MYLYLILNEATGEHKIGKSNNPEKRVKQLQTASPGKLRLISKFKSIKPFELETYVQAYFGETHVRGEWFDIGIGAERWFQTRCEHFEAFVRQRHLSPEEDEW